MASLNRTLALALLFTTIFLALSEVLLAIGHVHVVGDAAGWIIRDYADWSSSNNFQVGDILLFGYNKNYHNVMQVNREDFETCNINSPIATYNTGSDSITLKRPGHYYYLCGAPGHCQAGQKLEVVVSDLISPSPVPTPTPTAPSTPAPAPSPSAVKPNPASSSATATAPVLLTSVIMLATILLF